MSRGAIFDWVHVLLVAGHAITLPLATGPCTISSLIVLAFVIARLPWTWRRYESLGRHAVLWAIGAWTAWTALTILWSRDAAQGFDELRAFRMFLLPLMAWPVIGRAHWIVAGALLGVAGQNLAQALQLAGTINIRMEDGDRAGGLTHPIQTGAWCAAAIGWQLAVVLRRTGWKRWVSAAGLLAACAGLLVTGSRGPWLAAAITAPAIVARIALRDRAALRPAIVLAIVAVAAAAAAWPIAGDRALERVRVAREELRAAIVEDEYATSTGLRIALWGWAWEIFRADPLTGAGAGSFRIAQSEQPGFRRAVERSPESAGYLARDDAHCTPLHVLATTGIPGGLALLAVLALAIRAAGREGHRHAYAIATPFVVAGWIIVGFFGCAHLSGQQLAILALAVAAAIPRAAPPSAPTVRETTPP